MSKSIPLEEYVLELLGYVPGKFTVDDLVVGVDTGAGMKVASTGLPASRVRKTLGLLYGRGFIRVCELREGKEVWTRTRPEERKTL